MKRRASMTVEAAGIFSVVLLVIFSMLYLCLFIHDKNTLSAASREAALSGSMEEAWQEGNGEAAARLKCVERSDTGFFGLRDVSFWIAAGESITVTYMGTGASQAFLWPLSVSESAKVLRPAREIRQKKQYVVRGE